MAAKAKNNKAKKKAKPSKSN